MPAKNKSRTFYQITVAICNFREALRTNYTFMNFRPGTTQRLKAKAFPTEKAAFKYLTENLQDAREPRIERLDPPPEGKCEWINTTVWEKETEAAKA